MIVCLSVVSAALQRRGHAGTAGLCIGLGLIYSAAAAVISKKLLLRFTPRQSCFSAVVIIVHRFFIVVKMYAPSIRPTAIRTKEKKRIK
jgi:hypothetical protein